MEDSSANDYVYGDFTNNNGGQQNNLNEDTGPGSQLSMVYLVYSGTVNTNLVYHPVIQDSYGKW